MFPNLIMMMMNGLVYDSHRRRENSGKGASPKRGVREEACGGSWTNGVTKKIEKKDTPPHTHDKNMNMDHA